MDWTTIIISVVGAAAIGMITAWITSRYAQKKFLTENSKAEKEKAIQLAETYALNFVPYIDAVTSLANANTILHDAQKKLANIRRNRGLRFTHQEMTELFTQKELDNIALQRNPITIPCSLAYSIASVCDALKLTHDQKLILLSNSEKPISDLNDPSIETATVIGIGELRFGLLNRLEYFAMYFNTEIADSDTVYQSLHQTFLSAMLIAYFDISENNKEPTDYYFTNAIKLFEKWNDEFDAKNKKHEKMKAANQAQLENDVIKSAKSYKK